MARRPANDELTPKEHIFVANYFGSGVEAAKKAGYKEPKGAAHKLLKRPAIIKALAAKKAQEEKTRARVLEKHIVKSFVTKEDISSGILTAIRRVEEACDVKGKKPELSELTKALTSLSGSYDKLAELWQHKVRLSADISTYFEGRSLEEREFFCIHGYFPDTLEPAEPGFDGNTGMAAPGDPKGTLQ